MSDLLSIRAAAAEAPGAVALVCAGRAWTYAELATRVGARIPALARKARDGRAIPLVADNTLASVVTLLALLELRVPALLIHPRLTPGERAALLAEAARSAAPARPDIATIIHTSGTTGQARGAMLTRGALLASAAASAANLGWQDDDRWLACMPIARVGGLSILTRSLAARRTVVLAARFDVAALPALVVERRITLASLVPTMLARVLDAHPDWTPPAHLRAVLLGGAAASPKLLARAAERNVPVVLTYGLTETCSQVVATPYADRYRAAARGAGLPLPTVALRVLDGRIEVRGPMLMAGYWNAPPLPPDAWFDTGDLGALDGAGALDVHARRGDLVVTGGENVYPAEVERVLEECPGIAAAAVLGVPDETWGQTVAALLVAEGGMPPGDAELYRWIEARLAAHKRPRGVAFLPALPQTSAGKLDRAALAAFSGDMRPLRKR